MKRLLIVLCLVASLTACASYKAPERKEIANSRLIEQPFENLWQNTIQWFAINGTPIKTMDKNSGFIATDGELKCSVTEYLDCGEGGAQYAGCVSFNVMLKQEGSGTKVTVNTFSKCRLALNGIYFDKYFDCYSNGKIEKMLLDYIENGTLTPVKNN